MKNRSYLLFFIITSILLTVLGGCRNADAFGTIPEPVEVPTAIAKVEVKKVANLAPTAFPTPTNRPRNTPTLIPTLRPTATETTVPTATSEPTATTEATATPEPTATSEPTAISEPTATPVEEAAVEPTDSENSDTENEEAVASADAQAPEVEADSDVEQVAVAETETETESSETESSETESEDAVDSDVEQAPEAETDAADAPDAETETDSIAVASADEVIRSPVELRTDLGCSGCHNASEMHDPANPAQPGPNQATIHEYAGDRIPGMSAEEYIYNSIADPCSFLVEGYPVCLMLVDYTAQMSEAELDGLVAWFLDPNRE